MATANIPQNHAALVAIAATDIHLYSEAPTTTSVQVAKRFGKLHKDVLRAIRNLECSDDFNRRNFAPVEYMDEKGEMRPMYRMTKDGFLFLAMGLTGKEAAQWKEAYIEAFNRMSDALSRYVSFGVPGELYARALEAEKKEAASASRASVAGRALSLRRKEKKVFQGIAAMVREEVQLRLLLGNTAS